MGALMIGLLGASGASLWLALLVATGFNVLAVCAGLLGMLYVWGRLG